VAGGPGPAPGHHGDGDEGEPHTMATQVNKTRPSESTSCAMAGWRGLGAAESAASVGAWVTELVVPP
jgi:hypothetical protein